MFIGEHAHTIDDKSRVSVPAKYRKQLSDGLVITRGLDHCLWIYTKLGWEKIAKRLASLPISQKKSRAFARLMLAGAWDAALDSQGRIVLPEYLRTYAGLDKHIIIAGLYNRIEVWNEDSWRTYSQQTQDDSDEIAEGMFELGI
jgi:MraZ protein